MPREITTTIYEFDELTDPKAKDRARDWIRQFEAEHFDPDATIEDAEQVCEILGIRLDAGPGPNPRDARAVRVLGGLPYTPRPAIKWSGFSCQGDGASFTGTYAYKAGALKAIKAMCPKDETLHAIAETLQGCQRRHAYQIAATITRRGVWHYVHDRTVDITITSDRTGAEVPGSDPETIAETLRALMRWIYRQLEAEYDYRLSNDAIDETIRSNGYTFTIDGKRKG